MYIYCDKILNSSRDWNNPETDVLIKNSEKSLKSTGVLKEHKYAYGIKEDMLKKDKSQVFHMLAQILLKET